MLKFLKKDPGCVLLDLGCGDGVLTMEIAKHIDAKSVWGVELDDKALEKASKKGITVHKADLNRKFPIETESVDVIVANQVIEHLINIDNFVNEVHRVLKYGGYAVISTENLASWHNIFALLIGKQPYSGPYVSTEFLVNQHPLQDLRPPKKLRGTIEAAYRKHNTVLAYRTLKKIFQECGFKIVATAGSGYHPFPGWISNILSSLDIYHSHFLVIKARKS